MPLGGENSTPGSLRDRGHEAKTQAGPSGRGCRLPLPQALDPGRRGCLAPGLVSAAAIDSPAAGGEGLASKPSGEGEPGL